jgi:heat shock protein beta
VHARHLCPPSPTPLCTPAPVLPIAAPRAQHHEDVQHIWDSAADGTFTVAEDPRGATLGRGTELTLFLKEDASEYLEQSKLQELVERYSQFVTFPIYLQVRREGGGG